MEAMPGRSADASNRKRREFAGTSSKAECVGNCTLAQLFCFWSASALNRPATF